MMTRAMKKAKPSFDVVFSTSAATPDGRNYLVGLMVAQVGEFLRDHYPQASCKNKCLYDIRKKGKMALVEIGSAQSGGGWVVTIWVNGAQSSPGLLLEDIEAVFS